jgi:hypothetical protein
MGRADSDEHAIHSSFRCAAVLVLVSASASVCLPQANPPQTHGLFLRSECQRYLKADLGINEHKTQAANPYDREWMTAQQQLSSQDCLITAIMLLPHAVTEDHFLIGANFTFGVRKDSA